MDDLGKVMNFTGFALAGELRPAAWAEMLNKITTATKMQPVGEPAQWNYPTEDDKGGKGTTLFQPITESFLALDTWPDHKGAYLIVCSCKNFQGLVVKDVLWRFGLTVKGEASHTLRIS